MGSSITPGKGAGMGMGSSITPGKGAGMGADDAGSDDDDGRSEGSGDGSTTVPEQSLRLDGRHVPGLFDREPATSQQATGSESRETQRQPEHARSRGAGAASGASRSPYA